MTRSDSSRRTYWQSLRSQISFQPWWLPAVGLGMWRAVAIHGPFVGPAIVLGGGAALVGLVTFVMWRWERSHDGRPNPIVAWFERTSVAKLLLVSFFVLTPLVFIVVGAGMVVWEAVVG